MSPEEVKRRVAEVADLAIVADDDERAHGAEDSLYADLLRAIADGTCADPQRCAQLALETQTFGFSRWSA